MLLWKTDTNMLHRRLLLATGLGLLINVVVVLGQDEVIGKSPVKRSYVCPPNFVRLSHKCYFFSSYMATFQDAYWKCRDLHSNLAIIKNANQDKLIKQTLYRDSLVPLERWLGGVYDWEQMAWKWAASGKPLSYQGFAEPEPEEKEKLRWHCIIVDPTKEYKWSSRSCLERKHFICHTKIKVVTNKGKKKLQRQYNVGKNNQLNEVPVPVLPEDNSITSFKDNLLNDSSNRLAETNELGAFAHKPKPERKRKGKDKASKNKRRKQLRQSALKNVTSPVIYELPRVKQGKQRINRRRRNKSKEITGDTSIKNIKWKTYYSEAISPLHPKAIVEEFVYTPH